MNADRARTIIVVAKEPRPGRVKTRLQSRFTAQEAAELAAAALADTTAAVRASRAERRVLAWDGDPTGWGDGFEVVRQPEGDLTVRLAAAFSATRDSGGVRDQGPTLLIGMDTPQVEPSLLDATWDGADAVLGLSEDGGFWAIGLRDEDPSAVFAGIPMSTDRTGAAQLARLVALGLRVRLLPPLRDIDNPADAETITDRFPRLRFSRRHRDLVARHPDRSVDRLFDRLYDGSGVCSRELADDARGGEFVAGLHRWTAAADPVDQLVVTRCESPVLDIACGPGRMVSALQSSGLAALGIDISRVAVALGTHSGAAILRRRLGDLLPGEGRWGTALLLDGNVGIEGDVGALLARCRELVGPGGLIICEVDPDPDREEYFDLVLADQHGESEPMPWASVGLNVLQRAAAALDVVVVEEWVAGGRAFVSLRTAGWS